MAFKKAHPQQGFVKLGIYGKQGSGKTATSLLFAEGLAKAGKTRIAYIDTERGTDFYAKPVPARAWHPAAFDFDAIYTRSLSEVLDEVRKLNFKEHGVIVLDSVSHLWEAAINAYSGNMTSKGGIPVHAWGAIKKPYKELIGILTNASAHTIICGRESVVIEPSETTGNPEVVGSKMKAEGETPYEPHILINMYQARQNGTGFSEGQCVAYFEKDRTGLFNGKSFGEPNFKTIEPMLALLGTEQAQIQSDTSEEDAGLITDPAQVELEKLNISLNIKDEFLTKIQNAKSIETLVEIWQELHTKDGNRFRYKTKLLPEHLELLTQLKDEKKNRLTDAIV